MYPFQDFQETVTLLRLFLFVSPLMFVLGIQRISRPMINLLVARFSPNECEAATAIAVLTATYPLGRMAFGWLNQLRTISPTFQKVSSKREATKERHTYLIVHVCRPSSRPLNMPNYVALTGVATPYLICIVVPLRAVFLVSHSHCEIYAIVCNE